MSYTNCDSLPAISLVIPDVELSETPASNATESRGAGVVVPAIAVVFPENVKDDTPTVCTTKLITALFDNPEYVNDVVAELVVTTELLEPDAYSLYPTIVPVYCGVHEKVIAVELNDDTVTLSYGLEGTMPDVTVLYVP